MSNKLMLSTLDKGMFYKDINKKEFSNEYLEIVKEILYDDNWFMSRSGIYYTFTNKKYNVQDQGWKIHISTKISDAIETLKRVVSYLNNENISFKIVADKQLLYLVNSKPFPRGGSGKFITIYPKDTENFKKILEDLYALLIDMNGPYILSDKRYKDCKVLYYRYGGLKGHLIVGNDGNLTPMIYDGNGNLVVDERNPIYKLPDGIEEVIETNDEPECESYLEKNYNIDHVLHFSNTGGVYFATDKNNNKVVIKEARRYTGYVDDNTDAVELLQHEYKILKELEHYGKTPKAIEIFEEWEHTFLVEEYLTGENFYTYCANNNPFYRCINEESTENIKKYIENIIDINLQIVDFLKQLHSNDIAFVDLSANNVLICDGTVKYVDLEACININDNSHKVQLATKGFSSSIFNKNIKAADLYSLGCLFFNQLNRHNELIGLDSKIISKTLSEIKNDCFLPDIYIDLIERLTNNNYVENINLDEIELILNKSKDIIKNYVQTINTKNTDLKSLINIYNLAYDGYNSLFDYDNNPAIVPITPLIDNNINLLTGASGVVSAKLHLDQSSDMTKDIAWLKNSIKQSLIPNGLFTGKIGALWTLYDCGEKEYVFSEIEKDKNSIINMTNYNMIEGLAGIGLFYLYLYNNEKDNKYLKMSETIAEKILENAVALKSLNIVQSSNYTYSINANEEKICWPEKNNQLIKFGYGYGASGISLFLIYMYKFTGNNKYLNKAEAALETDLSYLKEDEKKAVGLPESSNNMKTLFPYISRGTAGILLILSEFYKITKDDKYKTLLIELVPSIYIKYTVNPGLYNGLSGLVLVVEQIGKLLNENNIRDMAINMAHGLKVFCINYNDKILFPGDHIMKLSGDYGDGTAGILLVLKELCNKKSNFHYFKTI